MREPIGPLISLALGAAAGWLAGQIMQGRGFGVLGNVAIGILGGLIGSAVFRAVGVSTAGLLGELTTAVVGAMILIFIVRKIRK